MDLTTFMSWPQAVGKGVPLTTKKGGFAGARAVAAPVLSGAHQPSLTKSDFLIVVVPPQALSSTRAPNP